MTAKKVFPDKLIEAHHSKSIDFDSISRLLDILVKAGQDGITIKEINDKYYRSLSRNTICNYLGVLQGYLDSQSTESSGRVAIEQFKRDGEKPYYYRINDISMLQSLFGSVSSAEYLSSRLISFRVPRLPGNTSPSRPLCGADFRGELSASGSQVCG